MGYHSFVFTELDLIWRCRDGTLRSGRVCLSVWCVRVRWRVRVRVCVRVCVSEFVFTMELHCDAVFSGYECGIHVLVPDNSSMMSTSATYVV